MECTRTRRIALVLATSMMLWSLPANGQQRRLDQDPTLNNLAHADGYETGVLGELGRVDKVGAGPKDMIFIAGAGFGAEIWDSFMATRTETHTMYAVTLAGFGDTVAPAMPEAGTSYGDQTWTHAAKEGIQRLIAQERLQRPIVVGHWLTATQVALRVALDNPDKVSAVIIISGIAKSLPRHGPGADTPQSLRAQVEFIDTIMAPRWFKTVTRDTWDDNNFYPGDYARHPVRALQLWRMAASPTLPVWIRYLCEAWAQDVTLELDRLRVPMLLLMPGFDADFWFVPEQDYMRAYTQGTWDGIEELNELITVHTVPDTRVFIMDDQPELLDQAIEAFLLLSS